MKVLITGVAGFISSQLAHSMLTQCHKVIGVDFFDGSDAQLLKKMRLNDIWNRPVYKEQSLSGAFQKVGSNLPG